MSYYDPHHLGYRNQNYKYQKKGQIIQKKVYDYPPDFMHVSAKDKAAWFNYLMSINYRNVYSKYIRDDPAPPTPIPDSYVNRVTLRGFREGETLDDYLDSVISDYPFIQFHCQGSSSDIQITSGPLDPGSSGQNVLSYRYDLIANRECFFNIYTIDGSTYFQVVGGDDSSIMTLLEGGGIYYSSDLNSVGDQYSELLDEFKSHVLENAYNIIGYTKPLYNF